MPIKFTKLQGAGNDFVLVEARAKDNNWPELARAMCRRYFGIGADGLLVLSGSDRTDFGMRMFNPDGSEAEACGNGLRCLVRYIIENGLNKSGQGVLSIQTKAGTRTARLIKKSGRVSAIQVGMGQPRFAADEIPVNLNQRGNNQFDIMPEKTSLLISGYPLVVQGMALTIAFVSMGNPHAIFFQPGQPVANFPLSQLGPAVESDIIFPRKTNFEVARVISRNSIDVRVWERGAGETLACGSGACAVAVAARLLDYVDNPVAINLPGGTLEIDWDGKGEVYLSGPAEIVFTGEWPEE